ncbi:hypothetical protein FHT09_002353 [Xanthomonas arboricola]|nr:hypothetical protein [Xanthomonas sp. CFBP 8152]
MYHNYIAKLQRNMVVLARLTRWADGRGGRGGRGGNRL